MTPGPCALGERIARELDAPVGEAATGLAAEIVRRYGAGVAAILFYGSCLRNGTSQGVLDFYVLVDDYRGVYGSRWLALANALLPPNVFSLEQSGANGPVRAKYAVMSLRDFSRAARDEALDIRIWARFCQPSALVQVRDSAARDAVLRAVTEATLTMVAHACTWLPGKEATRRLRGEELFRVGLEETYRAEWRSERPETIAALAGAARYAQAGREALHELQRRGRLQLREEGEHLLLTSDPGTRARARLHWRVRRPLAKTLAVLGLLKTALTFDDWVPYVLWKLERHGGEPIPVSARQRRHPFLLGWPVLFRLLRRGVLR